MRVCAFLWLTLEGSLLSLATRCIFCSTIGHRGGFGGRLELPEPLVLMCGCPSAPSISAPLDSPELGVWDGGARQSDRAEVMKLSQTI